MKKLFTLILSVLSLSIAAQTRQLSPGHPDRTAKTDLKKGFATPPKGYGEVPFYWWMGDTLTKEHLTYHLDQMAAKKVTSLQVNYAHSDKGGVSYGLTFPSKPALFTEEWWDLFGWFMEEAKKRNMTVSLSDYTLGVGQGSYVDDALNENPELTGAELKFESDTIQDKYAKTCHNQLLSLYAYQLGTDGKIIENSGIDLSGNLKGNKIEWQSPAEGNWIVTQVYSVAKKPSLDPMHPLSGKSYVKHFFQRFEDRFPEQSKGGLNFFFSDELNFNLHGYIWNSIFRDEFRKRKGYDIVPYLTALFTHIGPITPKIRLDYNDVMVSLSEENFFIPVYQWHEDRNLIYGCDHGGRGKDVSEFGDYFRTQRWNQAPGCDQPNLGKDIIKNKVASSIAHLYKRPRVWLEGFHSSNWDTNTANLTDATFANFVMGQNLLSLHGFYYSTMGGWWEWAPPCNHTHMPYWEEMGPFLECTERLSYILSQGYHRADVAILYPVESVVAGYDQTAVQKAFSLGEYLYREGVDFDFMDYESLAKASIKNSKIHISGEEFKVLIIPSMKAIRHSSLKKALQFKQNGGIVINLGELPEATEKKGLNDPEVRSLLNKLFGPDSKNAFVAKENQEVLDILDTNLTRDFRILSQQPQKDMPYIMHRKLGNKDLYAVYNVPSGTECFFRATGGIELWDPWTGKTKEITASKTTDKGTIIQMPMEKDLHLFVFDPAKKAIIAEVPQTSVSKTILLDGEWSFDLKPSLNNKFGDFHWPATDELLGAYIYKARYNQVSSETADWQSPSFDDSGWKSQTFTYGTKFMILEATPELSEKELLTHLPYQSNRVQIDNKKYAWKPYEYSWRWGVENDYGHQGWHGLKATVHDDFIRMGKLEKEFRETVRVEDPNGNKNYYLYSNVLAPETGNYQLIFGELKPADIYINGKAVSPSTSTVTLNRGTNEIVLHYDTFGVTYCVVRKAGDTPRILKEVTAEKPLATNFRGDLSLLPFDINRTEEPTYGQYRFTSAPGLKKLEFSAFGETKIWVNGALCNLSVKEKRPDGLTRYEAVVTNPSKRISTVAISIKEPWGNAGGAAIDGPIKQTCGDGLISAGDWTQIEGLSTYSGGAWYRKNIHLEKNNGDKVYLNLGQMVSTAEVWINKQKAGLKLTPPWRFDITEYIREGDNQIEILLYNTAANYYLSVPTMYRGSTKAGL